MLTSQQMWDTLDDLRLVPSGEAARVKARWFRPDRAAAGDADQFGRWLVTNGYLTKYALEQVRAGKAAQLRLGQYLLLEPRGPGGSFLASDTLGRKVQVDLVSEALAGNAELMRAFESAAERLMAVQSAHVNRVLDFGQSQDRLYLVREFDEGVTLAEVLARRKRLEPEQAARLFAQAFAGLQALHEKQVQGGDLGADSLLLAAVGKARAVKILHAGMPRALQSPGTADVYDIILQFRPLTRPEDDLFRLGQTLYLALTGNKSEANIAGGTPVPPLADVPELLAQEIENLLDPNVPGRPRVAAGVAKTLRVYLASAEATKEPRAEEEIAAPAEPARTTTHPTAPPDDEPPPAAKKAEPGSKAAELWEEVRPRNRELVFLGAGAAGILVLMLLVMLITGVKLMNVVCLLTGAAASFFAERLIRYREQRAEAEAGPEPE